ncbi:MAG TPA: DUF6691 family protein [Pseudomonadales bacterium]|nr:DUF6691 family protein [Pseudomonadales bacterium]
MNVGFFAFLSGLVFGIGLLVSGMANPEKVLNFLDITGHWDPSLMLVMVGAIAVGLVSFSIAKKRTLTFLGLGIKLPTADKVDKRLVGGSVLFGMGWGLAGFCPGPALVALGTGEFKGLVFVLAMIAGMLLFEAIDRPKRIS